MPATQTRDPVTAVVLVRLDEHSKTLADHEVRIRPLENLRAQLLVLATLGAAVGAVIANFLLQR